MTRSDWTGLGIGAILFALAACVPFVADGYWMAISVTIAMYGVLATSWSLFSGPTHYISLATGAFFGVGGYLVGTGMSDFGMSYLTMTVVSPFVGAILAALIGFATLRLSGVYFVIFTLGLAEMIRNLVSWIQNNFTGSRGLYVLTDITERMIYWELLGLGLAVFLFGWWLKRSRLGFALRIIGADETVARHLGVDTATSKIVLFTTTGFVGALVGAIIAARYTYIEPNGVFSPELSFLVVIMALLGGLHRLWGPLIGVIPFTLLFEAISISFPNYTTLLLGVAFLLIVYAIPRGILGLVEDAVRRVR